jgi:hypothetical protein
MATGKPVPKVYQDIEATAGFYGPSRYASLLRFFYDADFAADSLSWDFFGLTAAKTTNPKASKLFAVGIIPPSANVTGNTLDRSASVAALTDPKYDTGSGGSDDPPATDPTGEPGEVSGGGGRLASVHRWGRGLIIQALKAVLGRDPTLGEIQLAQAIGWVEGNYGKAKPGGSDAENNWGGVQCGNPGVGNCRPAKDSYTDGKQYSTGFLSYATPLDGATDMVKQIQGRGGFSGLDQSGTIMGAMLTLRRNAYYGGFCPKAVAQHGSRYTAFASLTKPYLNDATKACDQEAVEKYADEVYRLSTKDIGGANGDPHAPPLGDFASADDWFKNSDLQCGPRQQQDDEVCKAKAAGGTGSIDGDAGGGDWKDEGSKDAQKAAKETGKTSDTPLNQTELGKKFQAAQRMQIMETQLALEDMRNTPPLRMLVNPRSFAVKGTKIVQDGNWSRNGHIIEHWGDEQDKISASGRVAGFYAVDARNANTPGLTRYARNFSMAWANLLSLYMLYKNNGGLYLRDRISERTGGHSTDLSLVGSIYIFYDDILYVGSFDSFNLTEDETTPFTAEYSFEFTVRAAFLLDRPDSKYDINFAYSNPDVDLPPPTVPAASPEPAPTKASQQAAEQRVQTIEEVFKGIRDSPGDGVPDIDDDDDDDGIDEIIALDQGG